MAKPRWYDWLGAFAAWTTACVGFGVVLSEGMGAPEEFALTAFMVTWVGGVAAARVWWLRRGGEEGRAGRPDGLTTGEMMAQRMELMEQRIYELEERLELTERMLLQATERQRLPVGVPERPAP